MESLNDRADYGTALALMMSGGLLSAFLGPELAALGRDWIDSPTGYAGSFILLAGLCCIGMLVFSLFKNPVIGETKEEGKARSLLQIASRWPFVVSIISVAVGSGLMSFIMTATPVNMNELCGYDLQDSKWVIQSHLAAMFLPSFLSPFLIRRFGLARVMLAGACIYGAVMGTALMGQRFVHFWGALALLGIGWNFLMISGTALLPRSYRVVERFKTQALNDFVVLAVQALASLSSGWFLFRFGWNVLVWSCLPFVVLAVGAGLFLYREQRQSGDL